MEYPQGHLFAEKYRLLSQIGKGGMGAVYRVKQIFLDADLALKILNQSASFDGVQIRRFQIEAQAAHNLNHPNLVKVHDFGLEGDQPYLVMELVDGVTLADYIKQHGPLTPEAAALVFQQVCLGLAHAHQQAVIHRDIKPSNIMLVNNRPLGSDGSVKIVDFGIAKLVDHEGGEIQALTRTGEIFGSPLYMSPEQCSGEQVDLRTDIYSLGCTLFESLTGTPPHVGSNALKTMMLHQTQAAPRLREATLGREFPPAMERVVATMLKRAPSERYQSLLEIVHDLDDVNIVNTDATSNRAGRPKERDAKGEGSISISTKNLYLIMGSFFIVGVLITVLICYHSSIWAPAPEAKDKLVVPEYKSILPETEATEHKKTYEAELRDYAEEFQNFPKITSSVVNQGHVQEMKFPHMAIGVVTRVTPPDQSVTGVVKSAQSAQGPVRTPIGALLTLTIGNFDGRDYWEALQMPSLLKVIGPNEFLGLSVIAPGARLEGRQLVTDFPKKLAEILAIASTWSKLDRVRLQDVPLNGDSLAALAKLPQLRNLELVSPDLTAIPENDPHFFCQQKVFLRLVGLTLSHVQSDEFLPALAHSNNLKDLVLEDSFCSGRGFKNLEQCDNLFFVKIKQDEIDDRLIFELTKLKGLTTLFLKDTPVSEKQLRVLCAKCPRLKAIALSGVWLKPRDGSKSPLPPVQEIDPRIMNMDNVPGI